MSVLVIGEIKYEHVYEINCKLDSEQKIVAESHNVHPGGKALYQSIAASRAGASVHLSSILGNDSDTLKTTLLLNNISLDDINFVDYANGHNVIIKDADGNISIITYEGRKFFLSEDMISNALNKHKLDCDYLLLHNGIRYMNYTLEQASKLSYKTVLNPSPVSNDIKDLKYNLAEWVILGIYELKYIMDIKDKLDISQLKSILKEFIHKYSIEKNVILTCGEAGLIYFDGEDFYSLPSIHTEEIINRTGAIDCFISFFITFLSEQRDITESLVLATIASSLSLSKSGGAVISPLRSEVLEKFSKDSPLTTSDLKILKQSDIS